MRRLIILVLGAALLAFAGLATACGGDGGNGGPTLEEFFQRVDELDDEFEADEAALDAQFNALDEDEILDEAPALLGQFRDLAEAFVDDLEALEAPDEARALQDAAVEAGRAVVAAFDDVIEQVGDAETPEEFFRLFEDEEFTAALERFEQVCFDAEQLAADNGITVDLNCEDEE